MTGLVGKRAIVTGGRSGIGQGSWSHPVTARLRRR